jgi:hypothetical protein
MATDTCATSRRPQALIIAPPQRPRVGITLSGLAVKFDDQALGRDAARRTRPSTTHVLGVFVDDRGDLLDPAAVGGAIEMEVNSPPASGASAFGPGATSGSTRTRASTRSLDGLGSLPGRRVEQMGRRDQWAMCSVAELAEAYGIVTPPPRAWRVLRPRLPSARAGHGFARCLT